MKSDLCAVTVCMFIALCSCLEAKTVAWWHLNEGVNGECTVNGEPVIKNSCNPDTLALTAGVLGSDKNLSDALDAYLPVYTNAFPDFATWCASDGSKGADGRGMFFKPEKTDCDTGAGGVLYTEVTDELKLSTFTVELFFKSAHDSTPKHWLNLVVLGGPSTLEAWGLRLLTNGRVQLRKVNSTEAGGTKNETIECNVNAHDGKWHHLAFTYDGETKTGTLYYDYDTKSSKTFEREMEYVDGRYLDIGSFRTADYGRWYGWVDEVRISDTVLGKDDFIRPAQRDSFVKKAAAVSEVDTVFFASFDSEPVLNADSFFGKVNTTAYNINESTGSRSYVGNVAMSGTGKWPALMTEGLGFNTFHSGIFAVDNMENPGYWNFSTNSPGLSALVNIDDRIKLEDGSVVHDFTHGSSTFEMFIKLKDGLESNPYLICQHKSGGAGSLSLRLLSDRKIKLSVLPKDGGSMVECTSGTLTADAWHHVAVVFDHENRTVALYVDYKLASTLTGILPNCEVDAAPKYSPYLQLFGGYGVNHPVQLDGGADCVRLTKRALEPHEFLRKNAIETDPIGRTRAWISFDEDYLVRPRTNDIPAGAVSSAGAVFAKSVPGVLIVDGDENVLMETNRASVKFPGAVFFAHNVLTDSVDMRSQTLEFFVKMDEEPAADWMNLVRFNVGDSSAADVVYSVR
ncbi:MAG: hypothetical protein J6N18_01035, partial [Kiritimatiellae bacterium]|nr:hypothetical protein [Kiritimatiellia bacterium]